MSTLLVVSDTHGNSSRLSRIIAREPVYDILIHCGDGIRDLAGLGPAAGRTVVGVRGNMDGAGGDEFERTAFLQVHDFLFMITHGDRQRAHDDLQGLYGEGRERGADVVVFGHTHRPHVSGRDAPRLFNPGPALNGCYGIIVVEPGGIEFYHRTVE
jgi:uncharacterized protein